MTSTTHGGARFILYQRTVLLTFVKMFIKMFYSLPGRQFPLKGRFMANVFIHFEPIGPIGGQVQTSGDLPPYVIPGSQTAVEWKKSNPKGHKVMGKRGSFATGSTELHHTILEGNVDKLTDVLDKHEHLINVRDVNGWTALHEAVRKGQINVVELLLNRGAELNLRTGENEDGDSPLSLAKVYHGPDHAVTKLLESRGARERGEL
jgi:prolyl 4-hydroxylase